MRAGVGGLNTKVYVLYVWLIDVLVDVIDSIRWLGERSFQIQRDIRRSTVCREHSSLGLHHSK